MYITPAIYLPILLIVQTVPTHATAPSIQLAAAPGRPSTEPLLGHPYDLPNSALLRSASTPAILDHATPYARRVHDPTVPRTEPGGRAPRFPDFAVERQPAILNLYRQRAHAHIGRAAYIAFECRRRVEQPIEDARNLYRAAPSAAQLRRFAVVLARAGQNLVRLRWAAERVARELRRDADVLRRVGTVPRPTLGRADEEMLRDEAGAMEGHVDRARRVVESATAVVRAAERRSAQRAGARYP